MKLVWDESVWDDYVWWQTQDRKVLKRINVLIKDVERNGNEGVGKPEPLKQPGLGHVRSGGSVLLPALFRSFPVS